MLIYKFERGNFSKTTGSKNFLCPSCNIPSALQPITSFQEYLARDRIEEYSFIDETKKLHAPLAYDTDYR